MLKGLASSEIQLQVAAKNGLSSMGQAAVPYLVKALDDQDLDLRREAALLLVQISPESLKTAK